MLKFEHFWKCTPEIPLAPFFGFLNNPLPCMLVSMRNDFQWNSRWRPVWGLCSLSAWVLLSHSAVSGWVTCVLMLRTGVFRGPYAYALRPFPLEVEKIRYKFLALTRIAARRCRTRKGAFIFIRQVSSNAASLRAVGAARGDAAQWPTRQRFYAVAAADAIATVPAPPPLLLLLMPLCRGNLMIRN